MERKQDERKGEESSKHQTSQDPSFSPVRRGRTWKQLAGGTQCQAAPRLTAHGHSPWPQSSGGCGAYKE